VRLNEGIDMVVGEFLARMDADDEMLPDRLQTQVSFFRLNTKIEVLGGAAILVDDKSHCVGKATVPETHEDIRSMMPLRNPIIHSTIMMRREVFKYNRYSPSCRRTQDYELWSRLIDQARFHNIQEPLIKYYVNNRKKTWKSIGYDFFVHTLVVIRLHSVRGIVRPFIILVRNLMVKSGLYTPQSSRLKKL
jgi:glycosyltransferase involved in cell wall biosynthesis